MPRYIDKISGLRVSRYIQNCSPVLGKPDQHLMMQDYLCGFALTDTWGIEIKDGYVYSFYLYNKRVRGSHRIVFAVQTNWESVGWMDGLQWTTKSDGESDLYSLYPALQNLILPHVLHDILKTGKKVQYHGCIYKLRGYYFRVVSKPFKAGN